MLKGHALPPAARHCSQSQEQLIACQSSSLGNPFTDMHMRRDGKVNQQETQLPTHSRRTGKSLGD